VNNEQPSHQEVVDATTEAELRMRSQQVPVNMYEASEAVVVVAPLPAVTPDDVTIELRDNTLRFWAHLRSAAPATTSSASGTTAVTSAKSRSRTGTAARSKHRCATANSRSASSRAMPTEDLCVKPKALN